MSATVSVPPEAITNGPDVIWNHIDGPLMTWAGQMHWLTLRERFLIWIGLETVDSIGCKRFPFLAKQRSLLFLEASP